MRSASFALTVCLNVTATGSLATGADHAVFASSTRNGSGNENAPLVRCPGSDTLNAASPALDTTLAVGHRRRRRLHGRREESSTSRSRPPAGRPPSRFRSYR